MGSVMYLSTVGMSDSWEYLDVVVPLCMMLPTGLFVMTEPFKDTIYHTYQDILKHVDPRVEDLPLMSSPLPTVVMCLAFVVFVKIVGPWYMQDKPAMKFKKVLIGYNFLQVLLSAKIFYEVGISGWFGWYDLRCQPVDYSRDPTAMRMLQACYFFYISKFVDFLATFLFVLRKKDDKVSTLHVIHHGIMPFSTWVGMNFTTGGHYAFFVLLSSFVHVWMHLYYMIAAMGSQYKRFIWWKKYLTELQFFQFTAIVTHSFQLCFRECDFPLAFVCLIGGHAVLVLGLFLDRNAKAWFDDIDYSLDVSLSDEDIQNLMFGTWNLKKTDENGNIISESEDTDEDMSRTVINDRIASNTSEQRRFVNFLKKLMVRLLY